MVVLRCKGEQDRVSHKTNVSSLPELSGLLVIVIVLLFIVTVEPLDSSRSRRCGFLPFRYGRKTSRDYGAGSRNTLSLVGHDRGKR